MLGFQVTAPRRAFGRACIHIVLLTRISRLGILWNGVNHHDCPPGGRAAWRQAGFQKHRIVTDQSITRNPVASPLTGLRRGHDSVDERICVMQHPLGAGKSHVQVVRHSDNACRTEGQRLGELLGVVRRDASSQREHGAVKLASHPSQGEIRAVAEHGLHVSGYGRRATLVRRRQTGRGRGEREDRKSEASYPSCEYCESNRQEAAWGPQRRARSNNDLGAMRSPKTRGLEARG